MRKFHSLRTASVVFVLLIMLSAAFFTIFLLTLLRALRLLPVLLLSSTFIPFLCLMVSSFVGTVISSVVSYHLLLPLRELIAATKTVAKGDFSVRLNSEGQIGEIAELIESFNVMTEDLGGIEMFRSDFINTFSHEFKTPIVSIRGFAKQLQNENLTPEERKEYTDIIIAESERLTKLSANVLLLSKLENQAILADLAEFSLDEQIRSDILLLEKQWSRKQLEIEPDLNEVTYFGNAEVLSQLWVNLLSNAIKFTPEGGKIVVRLTQDNENVKVVVRDNGIGMNSETLSHVFEKFYQGDRSRSVEGNGLGLSLVKRIVELCGGTISIESEEENGTSVYITLPKKSASESKQS
ncbi:MAG: HAMP domain-containing histidine kinase [Clostridia bacterium]|nr:HAMP domain-containing histidine kinase [Clostridia bacterium]